MPKTKRKLGRKLGRKRKTVKHRCRTRHIRKNGRRVKKRSQKMRGGGCADIKKRKINEETEFINFFMFMDKYNKKYSSITELIEDIKKNNSNIEINLDELIINENFMNYVKINLHKEPSIIITEFITKESYIYGNMLVKLDREKENCDRYENMIFDLDKTQYQALKEPRRKNNTSYNIAAHHRFPRVGYENTRVNQWRLGDATDYANVCPENTIQKNGNCISKPASYAMAKKKSSSNKVNTIHKDSNNYIVE